MVKDYIFIMNYTRGDNVKRTMVISSDVMYDQYKYQPSFRFSNDLEDAFIFSLRIGDLKHLKVLMALWFKDFYPDLTIKELEV